MRGQTPPFALRKEVRSLTAFRFLVAFYVFLFHINIRAPLLGEGMLGDFVAQGAVGMTMFFMLSGFILSHAYDGIKIDLRAYFWNRVARIYPIYALAALMALPWLSKDILAECAASSWLYGLLAGAILIVFGLLLLQAWLPQTFALWNNSASWSVSNEAFFYALFPYLSDLLRAVKASRLLMILTAVSFLSAMVPASAIVFSKAPDSSALFYASPMFRLPEFVAGIATYHLMQQTEWTARVQALLVLVLLAGLAHLALLGAILPGYTLHNWLLIPAVGAALVLLYKLESAKARIPGGAVAVWLGRISYSFYSFQFHVLAGLSWFTTPETVGHFSFLCLAFSLLLVVSAVAHHFVEEPARIWIRNRAGSYVSGKTAT